MFDELNAQDQVASMMEDNEVMDQLEEIGRSQSLKQNREESKQPSGDEADQAARNEEEKDARGGQEVLLDMLEDSDEEAIIVKGEE